jgi:hypothetical protein
VQKNPLFLLVLLALALALSFVGCSDSSSPGCAEGYQDNDADGVCAPACAGDSCGAHGECDDSSGEALCTCDEGYAGSSCGACADAHQDNDGDGVCRPSCTLVDCGSKGACDDSSGEALCECEEGYAGSGCEDCAVDHQDHDGDGSCEPSCALVECGEHGLCDDATGLAECSCADGYVIDEVKGCVCPSGGADFAGHCWYVSDGCKSTRDTCEPMGLGGADGSTSISWNTATLEAVAEQLGLVAGGLNGCCVSFGWVQSDTLYTHALNTTFYNWSGCFSSHPTLKACTMP